MEKKYVHLISNMSMQCWYISRKFNIVFNYHGLLHHNSFYMLYDEDGEMRLSNLLYAAVRLDDDVEAPPQYRAVP